VEPIHEGSGVNKLELMLPCPPSINHYHGKRSIKPKGGKKYRVMVYVTSQGKEFVRQVKQCVLAAGCPSFGRAEVAVRVDVHMPNNRGDHHNREKPLLDALEEAGVFKNDKQVIDLRVVKCHPVEGGRCKVTIWEK
jgi:Holliday junction resolvase RusA-like endonuclease